MKDIKYIEKCNQSHNGQANVGRVTYSKTGRTIYYKSKSFQSLRGKGITGNYYDLETGEEYWISGMKLEGSNRHWASRGNKRVIVDKEVKEVFIGLVKNIPKYYELET